VGVYKIEWRRAWSHPSCLYASSWVVAGSLQIKKLTGSYQSGLLSFQLQLCSQGSWTPGTLFLPTLKEGGSKLFLLFGCLVGFSASSIASVINSKHVYLLFEIPRSFSHLVGT
jgi:hypothetical protein